MIMKIRGRSIKYRIGLAWNCSGWFKKGKVYVNLVELLCRSRYTKHIVLHEETHRLVSLLERNYFLTLEEDEVATELVASVLSGEQISEWYMTHYKVSEMTDEQIDEIVSWAHFLLTKEWHVPIDKVYIQWLIEPHRKGSE